MKKKLFVGLIALFMTFGLASCASDGKTPFIGENGNWWIGDTDLGVPATGPAGQDGKDGEDGQNGTNGTNGQDGTSVTVTSVEKTSSEGLVDTYTITFSDGTTTTFTVTNGESNVIESIELTGSTGLVDTYTITFTNGSTKTFTVTNGKDGSDLTITSIELKSSEGLIDTYVINYSDGSKFEFVVSNGADGLTPYIGDNGNWWIGDQDTGVLADWEKANNVPLTPYSDGLIYDVRTVNGKTGFVVTGWSIGDIEETLLENYTIEEFNAMYSNEALANAHLVIPNYIGSVPVIGVGLNNADLNFGKVTLSRNTVFLAEEAFKGCNYLKEIDFNGCGIKTIPWKCFYGTSFNSITLPDSVTRIMDYAFDGVSLKSINLGNIKYYGSHALDDAFMDYVYLRNNVEYVGEHVFDSTFVYVEADEKPASWTYNASSALAMAYGVKNNGEYLYSTENDEVTIYQYLGNEKKLIIPATIEDKPITTIGAGFNTPLLDEDLFVGMTSAQILAYLKNPDGYITELVVGNNVKKIDKYSLINGSMFIYVEDSVEEIYVSGADGLIGTFTGFDPDDVPMALIVVEDSSKTKFRYESYGLKTYEELVSGDNDYEEIIKADIPYEDICWDSNKNFFFVRNLAGYEVLTYKGVNATEIVVPNTFKDLPVNSIGRMAFYYINFEKLIVGNAVSKIKTNAFYYSKGKVYIPSGVSIINANAMLLKSGSKIYTGVSSKPDDWDTNWNPNSIEVIYSTSLVDFNNL